MGCNPQGAVAPSLPALGASVIGLPAKLAKDFLS
jgi:hypothetical protein